MHGAFAGAPAGERNGAYRHGRYTQEARAIVKHFRELAKAGEVFLATTLDRVGKKPPKVYRRRRHVVKALAEAAKLKGDTT